MSYAGYLIKIGNYTFPLSKMKAESYEVTMNGQDLDSYRDANGLLHRNALIKVVPKVEFETPAMITNTEMEKIMSKIRENYIGGKPREKKCQCTFYLPEKDKYVTHTMYVPDITYQIYYAGKDKVIYNSVRFAFISYGAEV